MGSLKKLYGWYATGEEWLPVKVDSNGKIIISSIQTKARAYLGVNQLNIVNGVWTKVLLDTENYDIGSDFDHITNHRFTAPKDGYYAIVGNIGVTSVVADKRYYASIFKNTSTILVITGYHSSHAIAMYIATADIAYLEKDDYIELFCEHFAGVNTVDLLATTYRTFMSVHLLST